MTETPVQTATLRVRIKLSETSKRRFTLVGLSDSLRDLQRLLQLGVYVASLQPVAGRRRVPVLDVGGRRFKRAEGISHQFRIKRLSYHSPADILLELAKAGGTAGTVGVALLGVNQVIDWLDRLTELARRNF